MSAPGRRKDLAQEEAKPLGIEVGATIIRSYEFSSTFDRRPLPPRTKGDADLRTIPEVTQFFLSSRDEGDHVFSPDWMGDDARIYHR